MRNILVITFMLLACIARAADTVLVDDNGALEYPTKATFAAQNDLVSTSNLSVFVDTYRDGIEYMAYNTLGYTKYWTDCELKVLDKDGNIVYFFSTIYYNSSQVRNNHPSVADDDAVVYYYVSGGNPENNVCVKPKQRFTDGNSSIGETENASYGTTNPIDNKVRITAIQIYPSAKFRHLFLNPENSIMVWRQTPSIAEIDGKGAKLWRPAIIQFIR